MYQEFPFFSSYISETCSIILGPKEKIISCQAKSLIPADFYNFSNRTI